MRNPAVSRELNRSLRTPGSNPLVPSSNSQPFAVRALKASQPDVAAPQMPPEIVSVNSLPMPPCQYAMSLTVS